MSAIVISNVRKSYGTTKVLIDVNLSVPDGSITAVLGRSGSGKTTLLRSIAGFEHIDAGRITIDGRVVNDGRRSVRAQDRGVGYVPQDGALFPHLTVLRNICFGTGRRGRTRALELIDLVGLTDLADRYPHELSGGQQQRVALARAMAIGPSVVLLDEPFSSLDATLRDEVRKEVAEVLKETGSTTVLVTHDQDEALTMADSVAVLAGGRVVASATPRDLYLDPPSPTVAAFVGQANLLPATLRDGRVMCAVGSVEFRQGIELRMGTVRSADGPLQLLLRPEQLSVHTAAVDGAVQARVVGCDYHGHDSLVRLVLVGQDSSQLLARVPGAVKLAVGESVWISVNGGGRVWPAVDG